MRMGDFGEVYLVKFIHLRAPYKIFGFWYLWGFFWGYFLVFEIFKNYFGMRIGDFGGVYLGKFIHLRPYHMICGFW